MITKKMKMSDIIHLNYLTLSVINRFGIQLGFGDKTVEEICNEYKVNVQFFLEIINAFCNDDYFPQKQLQNFSVKLLIDYLTKTHRYYIDEKIPEIEKLIDNMIKHCYPDNKNIKLLNTFFSEYENELIAHTKREEKIVFPYALAIESSFEKGNATNKLLKQMESYSINNFMNEHDNLEEKLYDLKNIIIKYLPKPKNSNACNKVLYELFNLEKDINDHSRIEEKIMAPKIVEMEKVLSSKSSK